MYVRRATPPRPLKKSFIKCPLQKEWAGHRAANGVIEPSIPNQKNDSSRKFQSHTQMSLEKKTGNQTMVEMRRNLVGSVNESTTGQFSNTVENDPFKVVRKNSTCSKEVNKIGGKARIGYKSNVSDVAFDPEEKCPGSGREKKVEKLSRTASFLETQVNELTNEVEKLGESLRSNSIMSAQDCEPNEGGSVHLDLSPGKLTSRTKRQGIMSIGSPQKDSVSRMLAREDYLVPETYETLEIEQLRGELYRVSHLVREEHYANVALRVQYESQLRFLREGLSKQLSKERIEVSKQYEKVLRKYYELAKDATFIAREERNKALEEKKRLQRIAKKECESFEKRLKEETQMVLERYREVIKKLSVNAMQTRELCSKRCADIEKNAKKGKQQFEFSLLKEIENRVIQSHNEKKALEIELSKQREYFKTFVTVIAKELDARYKQSESGLKLKFLQILQQNKVEMSEDELGEKLGSSSFLPKLPCDIVEMIKHEAEKQLGEFDRRDMKKSMNSGNHKY